MIFPGKLRKALSVVISASLALSANIFISPAASNATLSEADRIVGFALSRVGMGGADNEATLYYNMFGQNVPWDCMFVSYCATACGYASAVPSAIYCYDNGNVPGSATFFKERGQWQDSSYIPKKGDIIFFDPDKDNIPEKCGLVADADKTCIHTVEGNSDDCVKQCFYQTDSPVIYGYGTPDYASAVVEPFVKPTNPNFTYIVTSAIGCWLRSSCDYDENKLGVLNTGQLVTVDDENGSWLHIVDAEIDGAKISGWAHSMNLKKVTSSAPAVTTQTPAVTTTTKAIPVMTTSSTTNTTTTTTVTTTATTTTTTQPSGSGRLYYISSDIGAWLRSEPSFSESNKVCILDTDTKVRVYSISNEWAKVTCTANGSTKDGYLHYTVLTPCLPVYQVTSPIGCRLRSSTDYSENTIAILDTWQRFEASQSPASGTIQG